MFAQVVAQVALRHHLHDDEYGVAVGDEAAQLDERLRARLPRILLASAVMGVAIWALMQALGEMLYQPGTRYLALMALVLGGMLVYAVAVLLLSFPIILRGSRKNRHRQERGNPAGTQGGSKVRK